jgi:hypothetical protein
MYYKKKRSIRTEEIGGLTCHVPPKPRDSSKIRGSHLPRKEQKWYREGLPKIPAKDVEFFTDEGANVRPDDMLDWHVARRQEIIKQTAKDPWMVDRDGNPKAVSGVIPNPNYVNPVLDQVRKREFQRCYPWPTDPDGKEVKNGLWFMNNGEAVYLTPFHYFYLEWWPLNTGYGLYRDTDRQKFYFWQYCFEDPMCYGFLEVDKRGGGKCLEVSQEVRMYSGETKKAGDVEIGDLLTGDDGTPRLVVDSYRGESEKSYRIVPKRGGESHVVNENHTLALYYNAITGNRRNGWKPKSYVSMSVKEYLACTPTEKDHLVLYRRGWGDHWGKLEDPIIPPYMLGVWLGDGTAVDGGITNVDEPVREYVNEYADSIGYGVSESNDGCMKIVMLERKHNGLNLYRQELRDLGILNNKHIPESYLHSSKDDRMELLAGLLDTDGYLYNNNCFDIVQKNKVLGYQIVELARSLDLRVSCKEKVATMKRDDGTIYKCVVLRITISGDTDLIPNKVERRKAKPRKQIKNHRNTGFTVIEEGGIEYQGISVTDNKLFLLADGTVTHNSYRAAAVAYLRTIYGKNTHTGIQSKTEEDAREFFQKKLIEPYKKLPDFFIPINRSGTSPTKNIEFMVKSTRAKNAMELLHEQQLALNSVLDFKSAKETAYDGANITGIMLRDEEGKVEKKEADVAARHDVTKACVYRDGIIMGKIYSTTTVEEMEKGGEQYEQIFRDSNPLEKNDLGETKSGLYRLFMPAYMTEKFDEYGNSVAEDPPNNITVKNQKTGERILRGAKTEQAIRRKQFENDPKKLLRYCLKYPWHEEELFYNSAQDCPFNVMILEQAELHWKMNRAGHLNQMKDLGFLEKPVYGNFIWKDNIPFSEAIFVEDTEINSMWSVCYLFPEGDQKANNVKKQQYNTGKQFFMPQNRKEFFGGFDPTKSGKTVDKRRSKAGGTIFRKKQFWEKPEMGYHGTWVADFLWEPDDPLMQYDYFLIGLWYYGAQVLLENNIPTMLDRYGQYGAFDQYSPDEHFIMWRWEETFTSGSQQYTPGLPSNDPMNNMLLQNTQYHIIKDGHRLRLPRLIKDLKAYRESTRGKHDLSVSAQLSYMASTRPEPIEQQEINLGGLFRRYS